MKKRSILLIVLGLLFIIFPFLFNAYSIYRLLSMIFGIFLLSLGVALNKNNHVVLIIITPLLALAITYAIDLFLFYSLKRIPIYIYEIASSNKVSNYNSFFYRIYKCNNNLLMDYGYNKPYSCSNDSLGIIDINELLLNPQDSYTRFKNKFIRVHGKISNIVNLDSIELSLWEESDDSINGHVNFNSNYILKIPVNDDVRDLRIYDEIDVIGRVSKLNRDTLYLDDIKLIRSDIYNDWTYEIVENSSNEFNNIHDNYYYYGISELNVKYSDQLIYELSYLFNDKKMTVDDLIKDNSSNKTYKNEELNISGEEFSLDKFKILKCSNDIVIISSKKSKLNIHNCLLNK